MNERYNLNKNLAEMLKGGVIMDVTNPEQAKIAKEAGACAVMALERVPSDIRKFGGVARMSDPKMIKEIQTSKLNVSGVSLDEEMINLVQYQHAYNASAKVVSTINSLLDVVVNGLIR